MGCQCCCCSYSLCVSDALLTALSAWDSPVDLIPSVTDRRHIVHLLNATRWIKKGFAVLISLCFFCSLLLSGTEWTDSLILLIGHNEYRRQTRHKGEEMKKGSVIGALNYISFCNPRPEIPQIHSSEFIKNAVPSGVFRRCRADLFLLIAVGACARATCVLSSLCVDGVPTRLQ